MINKEMHLVKDLKEPEMVPIRAGMGDGLVEIGKKDERIVALCADLTESTRMHLFAEEFKSRFFEVGIAEQNLVTVAAGLAAVGKIPFASSYAAFCPGRCWEQIRTTICYNEQNVKIVGSHAGLMTGPDGATHQVLEDIALMKVLPNMVVLVPADAEEARKATIAAAKYESAVYIRLARDKTAVMTTKKTPFEIGKSQVLRKGKGVTIAACGTMVYEALMAAEEVDGEVINCASIKPFDKETLLESVKKTGRVVTAEEHQIAGGLGSLVAEVLAEEMPVPMKRVGVRDKFGESGSPREVMDRFGLSAKGIVEAVNSLG